uniref:Uncharacterized protein n=1 Tax=Gossypium raimondii TaxID=29730 RepID=A0A0D2V023_GOSRA|nr:hypothetical protein B456_009G395000 [Gossypium raimondii]
MFQLSFPIHLFRGIYRSILILYFSIDSFLIKMYRSVNLCVYIDPVHGLTKMCKSSICLRNSMSLFLLCMASPLLLVASLNSELNLKSIFRPGHFQDAPNNQRMASGFPCVDPISMET